ncbi:M1 family metallopeptidase [Pseudofulvibacter geojedonensis]|uniref:M1 family metallopeptidase n=1 Tax=Pseudofulvibacter geojedonensis TaxID=1123758 RepID=A0ABW3I536_9FLAO
MKNIYTFFLLLPLFLSAQNGLFEHKETFTRQDSLRGSITPERAWWDLKHYTLSVEVFPKTKTIKGSNIINFKVLKPAKRLQIDLQKPLKITQVIYKNNELNFTREGNVFWIDFPDNLTINSNESITIFYEGTPTESKNPPWSGGITWRKDKNGTDFIASSNQGIGASIWWPNKDHSYDEPDNGIDMFITVPEHLTDVSNGRLIDIKHNKEAKTKTFHWQVINPINNYGVNINIGDYTHFSEVYKGEKGNLDCQYWVLKHHLSKAKEQFKQATMTIEAFEHWFGPYPFYEDSFKLVEAPYLGMEHQSSVTYGNKYRNGYLGSDLSGTGVGLKFDFIIVHESGHEWFANNITHKDVADMWIHEGFTAYSENLYVDYHFSTEEANTYVIGTRRMIKNDKPLIGQYCVNNEGSGDMYYKGANIIHTIRQMVNDDEKWRNILRGLNEEFYHQQVTTQQIENYIINQSGLDLKGFFNQYLRTTKIPILEYQIDKNVVKFKFNNSVNNLNFPIKVYINNKAVWLNVSNKLQVFKSNKPIKTFIVDKNFYLKHQKK